jgi:hypothetical protein
MREEDERNAVEDAPEHRMADASTSKETNGSDRPN